MSTQTGSDPRKRRRRRAVVWVSALLVVALAGTAFALAPQDVKDGVVQAVNQAAAMVQSVAGSSASGFGFLASVVGGTPPSDEPAPTNDPVTGAPGPQGGPTNPTNTGPGSGTSGSNPDTEDPITEESGTSNGSTEPDSNDSTPPPTPQSPPSGRPTSPPTPQGLSGPPVPSSSGTFAPTFFVVTGLVAVPGTNPGEIDLNWDEAPVLSYAIYRGVAPNALTILDTTNALAYTDSGLVPGATYHYAVAALSQGTPGPQSQTASSVAQSEGDTALPTPELPTLALGAAGLAVLAVVTRRRT